MADFGIGEAALIVSAISAAYGIYSGERSSSMQEAAQSKAKKAALQQQRASDEANNRANQKTPDVNAILSAAQQSAKGGPAGTMLTGPSGVDPGALSLGKSTLLGG